MLEKDVICFAVIMPALSWSSCVAMCHSASEHEHVRAHEVAHDELPTWQRKGGVTQLTRRSNRLVSGPRDPSFKTGISDCENGKEGSSCGAA